VITILAILAAVTIIAINPARQLAKSRDAERSADVYSILSSIHQYAVDHDGVFPAAIGTENMEICRTDNANCDGLYDLSILTDDDKYLTAMPIDPSCSSDDSPDCSPNGSGYFLKMGNGGKITISAPGTELSDSITVTR